MLLMAVLCLSHLDSLDPQYPNGESPQADSGLGSSLDMLSSGCHPTTQKVGFASWALLPCMGFPLTACTQLSQAAIWGVIINLPRRTTGMWGSQNRTICRQIVVHPETSVAALWCAPAGPNTQMARKSPAMHAGYWSSHPLAYNTQMHGNLHLHILLPSVPVFLRWNRPGVTRFGVILIFKQQKDESFLQKGQRV